MKCAKGHEIGAAKFCGECGGAGVAATEEFRKCAGCEGEFRKADNFCPACGVKAVDSGSEYTAAIEELTAFHKARLPLEAEFEKLPPVVEGNVDDATIKDLMLKSKIPGEENAGLMDPTPWFEGVYRGQNAHSLSARAIAEHQNKILLHVCEGNGKMMKAVIAGAARIKDLESKIDKLSAGPMGRRTLQAVVEPNNGGEVTVDELGDLRGPALFMKAEVGFKKNREIFAHGDIARLETWSLGMNGSLKEISERDPDFGARVRQAVMEGNSAAN